MGSSINEVAVFGNGAKGFVATSHVQCLWIKSMTMGKAVKNCSNLSNVIYEHPLKQTQIFNWNIWHFVKTLWHISSFEFKNILNSFSFWPRDPDLHRAGDRDARDDGEQLRGGHRHRPPHLASPLHLPPDALPLRQLAGSSIENYGTGQP